MSQYRCNNIFIYHKEHKCHKDRKTYFTQALFAFFGILCAFSGKSFFY